MRLHFAGTREAVAALALPLLLQIVVPERSCVGQWLQGGIVHQIKLKQIYVAENNPFYLIQLKNGTQLQMGLVILFTILSAKKFKQQVSLSKHQSNSKYIKQKQAKVQAQSNQPGQLQQLQPGQLQQLQAKYNECTIDELSFIQSINLPYLRKWSQPPQSFPHLRLILIPIVAFHTLAQRTAFAAPTMTLTVFFETPALFAVAAFDLHFQNLFFGVVMVNFFNFFVVAVFTAAQSFTAHQPIPQAVTVIFLAFGVAAVASLAVGVDLLQSHPCFLFCALDFHLVNGWLKLLFHRLALFAVGHRSELVFLIGKSGGRLELDVLVAVWGVPHQGVEKFRLFVFREVGFDDGELVLHGTHLLPLLDGGLDQGLSASLHSPKVTVYYIVLIIGA